MSLRAKTLLILGTGSIAILLFAFFLSRYQVLKGFDRQDREDTRINIGRVENAISNEIADINSTTYDYSYWDETYAFIQGKDPDYLNRNVTPETLNNLRLDLMAFVDESGKVVHIRAYNFDDGKDMPIPDGFLEEIAPGKPLVSLDSPMSSIAGILSLPGGAMLIGSRPILTSLRQGPIKGTIIFGRFLDRDEAVWMSERIMVPLTTYNLNGTSYPEELKPIVPNLNDGALVILPSDSKTLAGYASIRDIYGRQSVVIKIDQKRTALAEGTKTVNRLEAVRVVAALFVIIAVLTMLDKLVLGRLYKLKRSVDDISKDSDLSKRVPSNAKDKDEISALELGINQMLSSMETSRKQKEEDERRYKAIVEQAAECVFIVDPETKAILEANSSAERITGFTREELLNKSFHDFHPSMKDEMDRSISLAMEHVGQIALDIGECKALRKDMGTAYLEANMSAVPYKGKFAIAVVEHDISERLKAGKALEHLRRQNELILESAGQGIIGIDKEGFITFANPSSSILTGFEVSELLGKPIHETIHHSKNNGAAYPKNQCPTFHSLSVGNTSYTTGEVFWRKDGSSFPVEYVSTPMKENGEIIGAVMVFNEESRTRFLNILSHELRTPLTPIRASTGMLLETLGDDTKSMQARLLRNIAAGVETLRSRIDDLIDTSGFQAGTLGLKATNFDPKISIRNTCELMRAMADEKGLKLLVEVSEQIPPIVADPGRFQQALSNLLQNAIKFSPPGKKITVNSYANEESLIVSVHDEGPGISKENQKRLFSFYFRASTEDPTHPGLGLGLSLTKQIIEKHGGKIWIESSEGAGSTFYFSMPLRGPDYENKE